jgi:hypothetical protein
MLPVKQRCVVSPVAERKDPNLRHGAKQLPPNGLVLRCIVFKNKQDEYSAECIDLDLLVYGKTLHDALHSLRDAITGYLEVAFNGDPAGLVPRPAPFWHRARYRFYALRAGFSVGMTGAKRTFLLSDWPPGPSFCTVH